MLRAQDVGKNETYFMSYTFFPVKSCGFAEKWKLPLRIFVYSKIKNGLTHSHSPRKNNVLFVFILS